MRPDSADRQDTGAAAVASLVSKVPVLGDALAIVVTDAYKRRRAVAERTALDIAQNSGGAQPLAERLADDPQVEALFVEAVEAVEAGARTGMEDRRRLLGRVVAAAVLDDAKVEDGQLLVQAVRELDAPHVRALEAIRRAYDGDVMRDPAQPVPDDAEEHERKLRQSAAQAATGGMPDPVHAALVRTGTVRTAATYDGGLAITNVSPFGRTLLDDLHRAVAGA